MLSGLCHNPENWRESRLSVASLATALRFQQRQICYVTTQIAVEDFY